MSNKEHKSELKQAIKLEILKTSGSGGSYLRRQNLLFIRKNKFKLTKPFLIDIYFGLTMDFYEKIIIDFLKKHASYTSCLLVTNLYIWTSVRKYIIILNCATIRWSFIRFTSQSQLKYIYQQNVWGFDNHLKGQNPGISFPFRCICSQVFNRLAGLAIGIHQIFKNSFLNSTSLRNWLLLFQQKIFLSIEARNSRVNKSSYETG